MEWLLNPLVALVAVIVVGVFVYQWQRRVVSSDSAIEAATQEPVILSSTPLPPRYLALVALRLRAGNQGTGAGTEPGTAPGPVPERDITPVGLTDGQKDMLDALVRDELRIVWSSTGRTLNQEQLAKLLAVRKKTVGGELIAIRARIAEAHHDQPAPDVPPNPAIEVGDMEPVPS